jgi:hypothetical protein
MTKANQSVVEPACGVEDYHAPEMRAYASGRRVVCFDLDGTLCEYEWPAIGKPVGAVIELLEEESERGSFIAISTCRLAPYQDEVNVRKQRTIINAWLQEHNLLDMVHVLVGYKPYADVYIDERAYNPSAKSLRRILERMNQGE